MHLYISRNGEQNGPYTLEEVQGYLVKGVLMPDDLAWHEGLEGWISLGKLTTSATGYSPPPTPARPEPTIATVPAKATGNMKLFIGLGAAMAVLAIAVGAWLLLAPKKDELAGSDPKPELPKTAGTVLWEFETEGEVSSSPAIGSDGTVYVGSDDNKLYAINGKTGAKLWEFKTESEVRSSPAIGADDTVYVGSHDKKLYAINGKTGVKLWEFETGSIVHSSPAIGSDGTVYVGSGDNKLYAIHGKSGVKLWEFETGDNVLSSPAISSDGTVYVGSQDNKLYAINGQTGIKLWEFKTGDWVFSSPAIGSDGTVYVGSRDKKLYAINGQTGIKLWEFETGGNVRSSPAIGSDGTVYVGGSQDHKLYAISGKTGAMLWEFETGGGVWFSSPAIDSDGTVYVGSTNKKLHAINGQTGVKIWEFETGGGVSSSPAIGSDGTVYVGSSDNKLYAIKTDSKGLAKSPWPMFGQNAGQSGRASKTAPTEVDPKLIAEGQKLFQTKICFTCHQTDPKVPAPAGLALGASKFIGEFWGKEREIHEGLGGPIKTVIFDEAYFTQQIRRPMDWVLKGALAPMPPTIPINDEELKALIAYVKSLSKK